MTYSLLSLILQLTTHQETLVQSYFYNFSLDTIIT